MSWRRAIFIFFVFKVLKKSRLCCVFFEAWVSEMVEPMLNCKKPKFLGILGFLLESVLRGLVSNVRLHQVKGGRCLPNVRLRST